MRGAPGRWGQVLNLDCQVGGGVGTGETGRLLPERFLPPSFF